MFLTLSGPLSLVRAHSFYKDDNWFSSEIGILMEFCEGSLFDYINARIVESAGLLTETEVLDIMIPICEGLVYLHSRGIIHRDIKIVWNFRSSPLPGSLTLSPSHPLPLFLSWPL